MCVCNLLQLIMLHKYPHRILKNVSTKYYAAKHAFKGFLLCFFYFSQCVVCMFGQKQLQQSYKSQSPLQREIFSLKKIPFQELQ